jgi:hypothetical protein
MKTSGIKTSGWLILAVILCLLPVTASAELERTIGAFDTRLAGQGDLQVSLNTGYETWDNSYYGDGHSTDSSLYIGYGIRDNWSVFVAPSFYGWHQEGAGAEAGISNTYLWTTYRFKDEASSGYGMAVRGAVTLPTGDEEVSMNNERVEASVKLLVSKDFDGIIGVANLGYRRTFNPYDGQNCYVITSLFEGVYPVNDNWSLNGALNLYTHSWDDSNHDVYSDLLFGARYTPNQKTFVSGGICKSLASRTYDWYYSISVGFEF